MIKKLGKVVDVADFRPVGNNLHILHHNVSHASRVLKETNSLIKNKVFTEIYIAGVRDKNQKITERVDKYREINRIDLRSRGLPKNLLVQLIKYIEFSIILLFKYKLKKIKVVTIHSFDLLPLGVLFKLFYKAKLVYDAHEYETQQGLNGLREKISILLEKVFIQYCDAVIVVSDSIADAYQKLYGNLPRPSVVLNTPQYREVDKQNKFRETFNIDSEQNIFLYQGALVSGKGIEVLLEAFAKMEDEVHVIVFMGFGALESVIKDFADSHHNIFFHDAVPPDVLLNYTASADFGMSVPEATVHGLNGQYCLPNKIFEYLMAQLPVIVSDLYEMRKLVQKYNVGVVAETGTVEGVTDAIQRITMLNKELVRDNIKTINKIYNWENQEKVLLKAYEGFV